MNAMTYSDRLIPATPLALDAATPAPFQRPGPDVLSETIPAVFIGRNRQGLWVARDAEAKFGGLFWRKQAAVDFAKAHAAAGACAFVFPQTRVELDMPNQGNPLLTWLTAARRLLTRGSQRLIAASRKHLAL